MKKLRVAGWTLLGLLMLFGAARLLARPSPPPYRFLEGAAYQGTRIDESRLVWRSYRMPGTVEEVRVKAKRELPYGPGNSSSSSSEGPNGLTSWSTSGGDERDDVDYGISVEAEPKGTVSVEVLEPPTLWDRLLLWVGLR